MGMIDPDGFSDLAAGIILAREMGLDVWPRQPHQLCVGARAPLSVASVDLRLAGPRRSLGQELIDGAAQMSRGLGLVPPSDFRVKQVSVIRWDEATFRRQAPDMAWVIDMWAAAHGQEAR